LGNSESIVVQVFNFPISKFPNFPIPMTPVSAPQMQQETDTEITLGTGKMLVLFFGLVLLCALFFGMGFTMGKNSVRSAPELLATPNGARPSAGNNQTTQAAAPQAQTPAAATSASADNGSGSANPASQNPSASTPDQNAQQQAGQAGAAQGTPPGPGYTVQVAAVSKQEDADALVEALKGHQYQAFVASPGADKLFHVQVGPFADIKDAEATRAKLVADGYNPILKK
jgi:cell division septation protein DedD